MSDRRCMNRNAADGTTSLPRRHDPYAQGMENFEDFVGNHGLEGDFSPFQDENTYPLLEQVPSWDGSLATLPSYQSSESSGSGAPNLFDYYASNQPYNLHADSWPAQDQEFIFAAERMGIPGHDSSTSVDHVGAHFPATSLRPLDTLLGDWVRVQLAAGVDPLGKPDYMSAIADTYNIQLPNIQAWVKFICDGLPPSGIQSGSSLSSSPSRSSAAEILARTSDKRKHQLADNYLRKQHGLRECGKPRTDKKSEGRYLCVWSDCSASFSREDDWRRHCLARQPNEVVVCDYCLNDPDKRDDKVVVTYRVDKIIEHRMKIHQHATGKGNSAGVDALKPAGFTIACKECAVYFNSVQECLDHGAKRHYLKTSRAGTPHTVASPIAVEEVMAPGRDTGRKGRHVTQGNGLKSKRVKKEQ